MKPLSTCLAAVALLLGSAGFLGAKTLKPHHAAEQKAAQDRSGSSPAGNINVPSTDFSKVEQPGDEAEERAPGGSIRPRINDSGQLGMGTGF